MNTNLSNADIAKMDDAALEAAYLAADKAWETDRRNGGWNLAQREQRNALADEIYRRRLGVSA